MARHKGVRKQWPACGLLTAGTVISVDGCLNSAAAGHAGASRAHAAAAAATAWLVSGPPPRSATRSHLHTISHLISELKQQCQQRC